MKKILASIATILLLTISCKYNQQTALSPHPVKKIKIISKPIHSDTTQQCNVMQKYQLTPPYQILQKNILGKSYLQQLYPTDSAKKLVSITAKSFFLGVYTSDLFYILLYYEPQYFWQYYSTIVNLAQDLGIKEQFVKEKLQKISDTLKISKPTIDTLRILIENSITEACQILDQNNQVAILPFALVGSWSEAINLIIGNAIHNQIISTSITKIISQQPQTIEKLKNYINDAMLDVESFQLSSALIQLKNNLDTIENVYNKLNITEQTELTLQQLKDLQLAFNQIKQNFKL